MTTSPPPGARQPGPMPPATRPGPLWARAVSEILSPAHLVMALPLAIGWHATWPEFSGALWGLVASLFCGAVPYAAILAGVRTGRLTDKHIGRREQRVRPLVLALASVVAGLGALLVLGAIPAVVVLVVGMLVALAVIAPITAFWKISLHAAVAAGTAVVLTVTFDGVAAALAWPLTVAVAAARVALGAHTVAQVVAGGLVGALVPLAVYLLIR